MKKNIVFALAILFAGCAASNIALTDVESANYKYGKAKFKGYSKEMFAQGRTISANNCLRCHKQKDATKYTEEQLNKIIPNMAKKAKITDEEKDIVLKYYIASGKHV